MREKNSPVQLCLAALLTLFAALPALAQSSAGSITGVVKDSSGAIIPGATATATSAATGATFTATSGNDGAFVFTQLPPANYTIVVERDGFKRVEKTGVILSTGDRLNAGEFTLDAGQVSDSVTVTADAGQLQVKTESGERSDLITNRQIKDLALNGRNILDLLRLVPGVVSTVGGGASGPGGFNNVNINGTRGTMKELTVDGSSNVGPASNGVVQVTINPDALAEVKVLTSNFQAEYGKAGGGFIQYTTKSGTKDFHGTGRYFRRHDSLNANTFFNNANGRPRPLYRYNYYGYDIGGPIYLPKNIFGPLGGFNEGKSKLFFFFNQEYYKQLVPTGAQSIRVPTQLERQGDFSQTTDGNGARLFIRDPLKTGTCTAANTLANPGACFVSNNQLHVIPANQFFKDGQAILSIYPLPNDASGASRFNYTSQVSTDFPRREDILRIDYNITDRTRLSARGIYNPDSQTSAYGGGFAGVNYNFPLAPNTQVQNPVNLAFTLTHAFSPTLNNEFIYGPSRNPLNIGPENDRQTRAAYDITFPLLFQNPTDTLPNFQYGGIANQTFPATTMLINLPRATMQFTQNFIDNLTKVWGQHTIKTGIFYQRGGFNQAPIQTTGNINFANDANNPLNTGHPFANALLGIFTSYSQPNNVPLGIYRYYNLEGYVQDTWRVTRRLTLDYGLRIAHLPPQIDLDKQTSVFAPELYDRAKAARLYAPILVGTARRAVDPANRPATPTVANTLPTAFIGLIVPNSGDLTNGIGQARNGYLPGGFEDRGAQWGPRFGFAYDVFGTARTVVRGGFGISYDRLQSNVAIAQIGNPPTIFNPQLFYGRLTDLQTGGGLLGPSNVNGYARDGKIPNVMSFSLNVQQNIGFGTVVDVAYVGTLGRHLVQSRNINSIPYFTTFQREAQDPSMYTGGIVPDEEPGLPDAYRQAGFKFSGARALPANFLRPLPGYGDINLREFNGSSNYNSLQVAVNRRFSSRLTFGLAYTFSKVFDTADTDFEGTHPYDTRGYDYKLADFDRTHTFLVNYVYDVPRLSRVLGGAGDNFLARALFDNYQLSGITQYYSGTPTELALTIQGINAGQRLTGSYTLGPRFYLKSEPRNGSNGLLIDPNAFVIPQIGDIGPWPRTYLRTPGFWNHDLSVFKNFPLGGEGRRYLQLRLEAFNVLNHTQFSNFNAGTQLSVPTGADANGNQQFITGAGIFARYNEVVLTNNIRGQRPNAAGATRADSSAVTGQFFGEYSAARSPRIIQLGVKLYF